MRFTNSVARAARAPVASVFFALALGLGAGAARADDAAPAAKPADTVREEVGKPLQAAQGLMKDKKFKEALAKIKEAEAIPNRTPYENFIIDRMRGSAAANDGQDDVAAASFESVVNSGRLPPADQLKIEQAISGTYFKLKNYGKSAQWAARFMKEGGNDPSVLDLLINSYYLNNEFALALSELKTIIEADEKAGRPTTEVHLQLMLTCAQKVKDNAASASSLEKLLISYPKKDYWDLAISHLIHRTGFAERLELDLLRLRLELNDLKRESEFMEMGQLCLEAGFPTEAKKVVDKGYAAGILGKGPEAERHKRLQAKVLKDAADDAKALAAGDADAERAKGGDGMVNAGYNYVINGKADKGIPLMEAGLKKGGLKRPEDAKMHLGIAYFIAGERAKAAQILRTVQGSDGTADLAHLWAVYAAGPKAGAAAAAN